jgi:Trm5-related predicted tRNA methylase
VTTLRTEYGIVRTATTRPFLVVGVPRLAREIVEGELRTTYGEPFVIGYAETAEAARKRVRREAKKRTARVLAFRLPTGEALA